MRAARNILYLGFKELRSLSRDPILLVLIAFALTVNIYTAATAMPETLHKAPIAIVDEDQSALSSRIRDAFYLPYFLPPVLITPAEMDARMDAGLDTPFVRAGAGGEFEVGVKDAGEGEGDGGVLDEEEVAPVVCGGRKS